MEVKPTYRNSKRHRENEGYLSHKSGGDYLSSSNQTCCLLFVFFFFGGGTFLCVLLIRTKYANLIPVCRGKFFSAVSEGRCPTLCMRRTTLANSTSPLISPLSLTWLSPIVLMLLQPRSHFLPLLSLSLPSPSLSLHSQYQRFNESALTNV